MQMIIHGDALESLRAMDTNSVDSIVTDPPAGISFMGKDWDGDKGGRDQWITWLTAIMREAHRVLKPGGHALVWAIPRTSHWTGIALEYAGFEVRDRLAHLFGSGFPKSLNVSKAIDKSAGATREVVGSYSVGGNAAQSTAEKGGTYASNTDSVGVSAITLEITKPATPEAEEWEGWGSALKPAVEDWWLARKPLEEKTLVKNVLKHGTGAINVDGCRVSGDTSEFINPTTGKPRSGVGQHYSDSGEFGGENANPPHVAGRWPANLILSHTECCERVGFRTVERPVVGVDAAQQQTTNEWGALQSARTTVGTVEEEEEVWKCVDGCSVRALDMQTGNRPSTLSGKADPTVKHTNPGDNSGSSSFGGGNSAVYADNGGASRFFNTFFYTPKASRSEREKGLDHLPLKSGGELTGREDGSAALNSPRTGAGRGGGRRNTHPTVKSLALMRWLCRLVTPPGGVVLDMFCGSGSTGVAAVQEGFQFIGCEMSEEYVEIARARIAAAGKDGV